MLWCCSIPYARAMLLAAEAHHLLFELCVMVSGLASVCDVASEPSFRFGSVSTLCARSCVLRTKVYERCTKVYERCREVYERCTEVYAEVYERCTRGVRERRGVREVYSCTEVYERS